MVAQSVLLRWLRRSRACLPFLPTSFGTYLFLKARDCESTFLAAGETHDPWNIKSCVATSTCWGPKELNTRLQCRDASYEPASAPALNKDNIYQPIVGDCDGDCSMTFDNFAQFISSSLSDVGSSGSPPSSDDLRANYWSYITEWTATEDVSYTDFNDWLFNSNA
ncbi:hypothetical protein CYLTODRAFT_162324 [Cylindrobasidium torrendii FP15055 ss-10]|uniref:Uncharacterized protein n=1 Tax=Cylindrobasidium torrendii FP15055 ss-10 TaxID=1314674 RepID=A0A0D7AWU6_9AGAR|nr:hypothetical protein CYLTODRAFT_162324 [Cylindrobasidium torrendii FP15055 ss-10]